MSRMIFCKKLNKEAQGLEFAPYPGELGEEIYQHISQQAWDAWVNHQTMLINEYRLNLLESKSREFLEQEMIKFLFAGESESPPGFVEQEKT